MRSGCSGGGKLSPVPVALLLGILLFPPAEANPYENVDWDGYGQYRANLHTHTTESDGWLAPAEAIDEYYRRGYKILALTDHNRVTWPWQEYGRDPAALGMIAVRGGEPSRHHHLGSYFCGVPGGPTLEETLREVRERDGIAVMFHPGRYDWTVEDYAGLYAEWGELVGMEVYNCGDKYPGDRETWDGVLTALMPERPVWGFSGDDMHNMGLFHRSRAGRLVRWYAGVLGRNRAGRWARIGIGRAGRELTRLLGHDRDDWTGLLGAHWLGQLGRNWMVFLLPELSEEEVRRAMVEGRFYFSRVHTPGDGAPVINSIRAEGSVIEIEAEGYDRIVWISGGRKVHEGERIDLEAVEGAVNYVRARLVADWGSTYTQPFTAPELP